MRAFPSTSLSEIQCWLRSAVKFAGILGLSLWCPSSWVRGRAGHADVFLAADIGLRGVGRKVGMGAVSFKAWPSASSSLHHQRCSKHRAPLTSMPWSALLGETQGHLVCVCQRPILVSAIYFLPWGKTGWDGPRGPSHLRKSGSDS